MMIYITTTKFPDRIEPVEYFMEPFNTIEWIWALRIVFALAFLGFIIAFIHYRRKKGK